MKTMSTSQGGWSACVALATAAFIFNTSEFIPVGLLSGMAGSFRVSEAQVGMIISVYAWAVALLSLPLMAAVVNMGWRRLMLWLVGLFAFFQLCSALTPTYGLLMAARVGVACCHAVFWGVVPPYAIACAPRGRDATALGIIVVGSSVAMIVGLPLGRVVGLWLSWRATFACIASVSMVVFACCMWLLPHVQGASGFSLRSLPYILTRPLVVRIYVFIFTIVTAYFIVYSYIEPFLEQVVSMEASGVTAVLVAMGFGGMSAGWIFSHWYSRHAPLFFVVSVTVVIAYSLLLLTLSGMQWLVGGLCFVVSIAYICFNMASQELLITRGPQPTTITVATYSGIFNLGIGTGAFLGGRLAAAGHIEWLGYAAVPVGLLALLLVIPIARQSRHG